MKKARRRFASSGRSYAAETVKAASHPTRQVILKSLQKDNCSTMDLEKVTGENRYNLYHHLSVLQDAGLVDFRFKANRLKVFFLKKPKRPDAIFLQLERKDPEDLEKFNELVGAIRTALGDRVPHLDKVTRMRLLLSYPWSEEEEA